MDAPERRPAIPSDAGRGERPAPVISVLDCKHRATRERAGVLTVRRTIVVASSLRPNFCKVECRQMVAAQNGVRFAVKPGAGRFRVRWDGQRVRARVEVGVMGSASRARGARPSQVEGLPKVYSSAALPVYE